MDKLKIALTLLSIAIAVGPIAGMLCVYRDNLPGLVLPPQIQNLINGGNSVTDQSSQSLGQFQMPQPVGQPQYDPNTGAFSYPLNFTNPLKVELSLQQFSADVYSENNQLLGNISINQPININPGDNAIINATGNLSQDAINQLSAKYLGDGNLNIALENVSVTVDGVNVHVDHIDAGSIPTLG